MYGVRQGVLTPETLKLHPGTYKVKISKPGFKDEEFNVSVESGKKTEKFVELTAL